MTSPFTDQALAGRTALVVGAAAGIGRAIADAFAAAGARVVRADLQADNGIEPVEVSDEAQVAALAGRLGGRVHVLAYAAAHYDDAATVPGLASEVWRRVIEVNLTGAFLTCKHVLPLMQAAGGGSVILVASQLGSVASPGRAAYCSSKGALIQLAKVIAVDHAADGIRANTLSPGGTATRRLSRRYGSIAAAQAEIGARHLLGRIAEPAEIAAAALFLASDASRYMTGADLLVDGGYNAV